MNAYEERIFELEVQVARLEEKLGRALWVAAKSNAALEEVARSLFGVAGNRPPVEELN